MSGLNPYIRDEKMRQVAQGERDVAKMLLLRRIAVALETLVNASEKSNGLEETLFNTQGDELINKHAPVVNEEEVE